MVKSADHQAEVKSVWWFFLHFLGLYGLIGIYTNTDIRGGTMALRRDSLETKNRILSVCVRLFIEQGYYQTTIGQILKEAEVSASSFQYIFHTKDGVLKELLEFMFSGDDAELYGKAV